MPPTTGSRLPYSRQQIDACDVQAVVDVLQSDRLTTGPAVWAFEDALASFCGVPHVVAVANGTAALHAAAYAADIGPGDEVIVPTMTFAATANCVVYQGARPVFSDVDPETLLLDPHDVESKLSKATKAVIGVDYAGQPCDYAALRALCDAHRLALLADASHSLGASDETGRVGSLADLTTFSFHPVKPITTGEGGAVVTDDATSADRMRRFRNHGIETTSDERDQTGSWIYEMVDLGWNYRLSDIHCALGLSQLSRLPEWMRKRQGLAALYDASFEGVEEVRPVLTRPGVSHARHLYVVRVPRGKREACFQALRRSGIFANVHYIPVHLHPYYRRTFKTGPGDCPSAEAAYDEILSLPLFPGMVEEDVQRVIETLIRALA